MINRAADRDRGSVVIEVVIGISAILGFLAMITAAGRIAIAHEAVAAAASDAARSASLARTHRQANSAATAAAYASLNNQQLPCSSRSVTLNTSGFTAPVGTPATVSATVRCVVNLSDLTIPGLSGHRTITATMTSPLDTYRERT